MEKETASIEKQDEVTTLSSENLDEASTPSNEEVEEATTSSYVPTTCHTLGTLFLKKILFVFSYTSFYKNNESQRNRCSAGVSREMPDLNVNFNKMSILLTELANKFYISPFY